MSNYSADFETAWLARPKRPNESKVAGWRAWSSALKQGALPPLDRFLASQAAYAAYLTRKQTAPEFIQHFATFVNKRSFEYWLGEIDKLSQIAAVDNGANVEERPAIPDIMSPVFSALGKDRFWSDFFDCSFEDLGDVLLIRARYKFMEDRMPLGLVERLTGRRVEVRV